MIKSPHNYKNYFYNNITNIYDELIYNNKMKKNFNIYLYKYLVNFNLLQTNYPNVSKKEKRNPIYVTSMSNKFVSKGIGLIKSIQKYFSNSSIIVYDLGINKYNLKRLKKLCNVIYKKFNFKKYPKHVFDLKNYAFKAIIIAEVLRDYKAIWYIDSSVSFTRSNLTDVYNAMELRKSSYILHSKTFHGIVRATVSGMFDYLPSNIEKMIEKKSLMFQAGLVYIIRDNESMKKIIKWYVLCSLQKECIAPKKSKKVCSSLTLNKYGYNVDDCHRFDQSIINIILWNNYKGNMTEYTTNIENFYYIERKRKEKWNHLKMCK
uniref:Nucleotid_trans domain-containing protein n=2 Tax=Strongyloides stercoralis TaxID=6248 RepID=A0A0K0ELX8_STRER